MNQRVLVVDDDRSVAHGMAETLRRADFDVELVHTGEEGFKKLRDEPFDLVVSDVRLPGITGDALLEAARKNRPNLPFLLVTAYGTVADAVKCVQAGAIDYLTKPFSPEALREAVSRGIRARTTEAERPAGISSELIAEDPATRSALQLAKRAAATKATVLLEAESGAGKEVFARFIHDESPRRSGPFVAVNCAAIPRELLEAELFGHAKGAFTGAHKERKGLFRIADGGTLLLDEIGELHMDLQARLLRVVQDRCVTPLGTEQTYEVDVRLLAATHRDLSRAVQEGTFRQDLYYRLRVLPLQIPALRERPDDVLPLAEHLLKRISGNPMEISPEAATILREHRWPGNVRELENVLQRAVFLTDATILEEQHLRFDPSVEAEPAAESPVTLEEAEREAIRRSLELSGGERNRAAKRLGISARTLRYKLKQYRDRGEPLLNVGEPAGLEERTGAGSAR